MPAPYCPKHGYAHPNCKCGTDKNFAKGGIVKKDLGVAYNMQRKQPKENCQDCMSEGGKCMAHGGVVENEKLNPEHEAPMEPRMKQDIGAMKSKGKNQSEFAKYKDGGVVDEIMGERYKDDEDYLEDANRETDFEPRMDFEPVHTREDEEHDTESGSEDDESLVGQIMKERKLKRRS